MKKAILNLFVMAFVVTSFAQKETISITQVYKDPSSRLIFDTVLRYDSIKRNELMTRFENWGGKTFRNYSAVVTSKSENQITLKYISGSGVINNYLFEMYCILVAEFKDDRFKVSFYDAGNSYKPGTYIGSTYVSPVGAATYFLDFNFEADGTLTYKTSPGIFNYKEKQANTIYNSRYRTHETVKEIDTSIKGDKTSKATNNDW